MNENKLISVIIPNYNKQKYIQECIDSVLNQSYRPIEIIIVDDCSTDDSRAIILELSKKYDCIRPIFQEKNAGVSHARNTGALHAAGEYITFLDSDDYYYNSNKLSAEMKLLIEDAEFNLSYSTLVYVDDNGVRIDKPEIPLSERLIGHCTNRIIKNCAFEILPRDYCVSKKIFIQSGMYDVKSSFYEDLDLLIRLSILTNFQYTKVDGTAYRQVGNGLSSKSKAEQLRGRWKVSWNSVNTIKQCRTLMNYIHLFIWKVKIECKIIIKKLLGRLY